MKSSYKNCYTRNMQDDLRHVVRWRACDGYCSILQDEAAYSFKQYLSTKKSSNSDMLKRGRKCKITERGLSLFHRNVLDNCHEPLYVILAKFNKNDSLCLIVSTGKIYTRSLNMQCSMSTQKPYQSWRNTSQRII